jgi:hypothetical protein
MKTKLPGLHLRQVLASRQDSQFGGQTSQAYVSLFKTDPNLHTKQSDGWPPLQTEHILEVSLDLHYKHVLLEVS